MIRTLVRLLIPYLVVLWAGYRLGTDPEDFLTLIPLAIAAVFSLAVFDGIRGRIRRFRMRRTLDPKERTWSSMATRTRIPKDSRQTLMGRDGRFCRKCAATTKLEIHHRKRVQDGGTNDLENLVILCDGCHREWHLIDKDGPLHETTFDFWTTLPPIRPLLAELYVVQDDLVGVLKSYAEKKAK